MENHQPKKAFLFDLNGTMIDDMEFHGNAWFDILNNDLNANLSREQVKKEMYGKNPELLERVFGKNKFSAEEIETYSMRKELDYQAKYKPHLKLIAGLDDFLQNAKEQEVKMAIGSAAIPFNIDFVLDNLYIRQFFAAVISADEVEISKPHPETFLKAAAALNTKPGDCIVFEDAPKGVEAAKNAGMKCVVLTTAHGPEDFAAYDNVLFFAADYTDPGFTTLFNSGSH